MSDGTLLLPFRVPPDHIPIPREGKRRLRRRSFGGQARSVVGSRPSRYLRSQMMQWALKCGRPLNVDAAVVLVEIMIPAGTDSVLFTDDVVTEIIWVDAIRWCEDHGVELPSQFAETLHTAIDFLADTDRLDPLSDPTTELHYIVNEFGEPLPPRTAS